MEADEIKEKKMAELKKQYDEQQMQAQKAMQAEMQIDNILRTMLTTEAKTRLSNVKMVNRELYMIAVQNLVYLKKAGQLPDKVTDAEMKSILEKLRAGKKEITIKRK